MCESLKGGILRRSTPAVLKILSILILYKFYTLQSLPQGFHMPQLELCQAVKEFFWKGYEMAVGV